MTTRRSNSFQYGGTGLAIGLQCQQTPTVCGAFFALTYMALHRKVTLVRAFVQASFVREHAEVVAVLILKRSVPVLARAITHR